MKRQILVAGIARHFLDVDEPVTAAGVEAWFKLNPLYAVFAERWAVTGLVKSVVKVVNDRLSSAILRPQSGACSIKIGNHF